MHSARLILLGAVVAACGGQSAETRSEDGAAGSPSTATDGTDDAAGGPTGLAPPRQAPPLPQPASPVVDPTAQPDPIPPDPAACSRVCPTADELRIEAPSTEAERVFNLVVEDHLDELHHRIGRYACGDDAVYAGTFSASDDVGEQYDDPYVSNALVEGDVVGSIHVEWPPPWNGSAKLTLVSPAQQKHLQLEQDPERPSRTEGSNVADFDSSYLYNRSGCSDCAPPFADFAPQIVVDGLVATGITVKWTLRASGVLDRVAPERVSLTHLAAIAAAWSGGRDFFADFEPVGAVRARVLNDDFFESAEPPADPFRWDSCWTETAYSIEQHVNAACPADYGVRNLNVESQRTCCSETLACPPGRSGCDTRTVCF